MQQLLADNPILLLFLVAAAGFLIGKVKIKGVGLGVSAVLFVGLAVGTLNENYNVPSIVFQLGLILFVYSVGISSGPAFFQSFNSNGWRDISYILVTLAISFAIAIMVSILFGFGHAVTSGLYSGSSTNTTALASIIEMINNRGFDQKDIQDVVIGYSYSYPLGVIGVMAALKLLERVLKIDYASEKTMLKKQYHVGDKLTSKTVAITNKDIFGHSIRDLLREKDLNINFGRIKQGESIKLTSYDTNLEQDDILMIVGAEEDLQQAINFLGTEVPDTLHHDRQLYDIRRIFVSNTDLVGKSISSLNISEKYDAVITRIRRGDVDMLATPETVLELGDRIRFVARRKDLDELSKFFGDSYYESSRINMFSFGLGIALGLLLGTINFTLPGGLNFKFGYAGGPLLVGLVLGSLRRTGPIVWTLPYATNVTIQQIGLMLLLAVIGLKSGNSFLESLGNLQAINLLGGALLLTVVSTVLSVIIGFKVFKIPFTLLLGFMSNQPAILEFSHDLSKSKIPNIGYTVMFPIAMIIKILFAQLIYLIL